MKVSMKAMRVNRDMTQREAAEKIGIRRETLQSWEAGRTFPQAQKLKALCEVYRCKMDDIFLPDKLTLSK